MDFGSWILQLDPTHCSKDNESNELYWIPTGLSVPTSCNEYYSREHLHRHFGHARGSVNSAISRHQYWRSVLLQYLAMSNGSHTWPSFSVAQCSVGCYLGIRWSFSASVGHSIRRSLLLLSTSGIVTTCCGSGRIRGTLSRIGYSIRRKTLLKFLRKYGVRR
jgi:hypothetical protein